MKGGDNGWRERRERLRGSMEKIDTACTRYINGSRRGMRVGVGRIEPCALKLFSLPPTFPFPCRGRGSSEGRSFRAFATAVQEEPPAGGRV